MPPAKSAPSVDGKTLSAPVVTEPVSSTPTTAGAAESLPAPPQELNGGR